MKRITQPLFHGTAEPFDGPLRALSDSGTDEAGLLWTATCSGIAQTYIPESGVKLGIDLSYPDKECLRPDDRVFPWLCDHLGITWRSERDSSGRTTSWACKPFSPKFSHLRSCLRDLGYNVEDSDRFLWVKATTFADSSVQVLPVEQSLVGRLFIVQPKRELDLFDLRDAFDHTLSDPQYHRYDFFRKAYALGKDGVLIRDYCQTEIWGNVEHESIGLFERALADSHTQSISAKHFEWSESEYPSDRTASPEYARWSNGISIRPRELHQTETDVAASLSV